MKRIYTLIMNLSLGFAISCAVIPASTEENPTLLVGEIIFLGDNYISNNGISFKGTFTSNINVFLRNIVSNEIIKLSSNKSGLFYSNLKEGKYMIDELYITKESAGGASAYIYTGSNQKMLEIEKGKVNNIGTIRWSFVDRKHRVIQIDNSITVRNDFTSWFPKSNWNQKEWKYNPLSSDLLRLSDETTTYYVKSDDGLDSTMVKIPLNIPDDIRQRMENEIKKKMNEIRASKDTTKIRTVQSRAIVTSITYPDE